MSALMVLLVALPLVSMLVCVRAPHRVAAATTALTGIVALLLAAALVPQSLEGTISAGHYLRADALSVIFLLGTCFLYATVGVYSIGYFADEERAVRSDTAEEQELFARYSTRFFLGLNAFAWSMICAPLVNSLTVLWIAVEITTVVSALLVALDNTEGATEAAWKYVLIASSGLGIALLATIFMYYSGAQVLGESYDLALDPLVAAGSQLPATPVRLAFVLAVVGFGTKVGLFPVHTWLPDAHAEAPTPVSALLSGSLLAVSFYAILRYYQIATAALGSRFPQTVLMVFGVLSLLLAALYLLEQRDIKRLLAYSSVEHMGIIAIGVSFGAPIAFSGVLLHVLAHAAAKANAFMGAGVLVRKFGTKELGRMTQGIALLPWSGPMFLIAVLALSAMPPFGLFRSEFQIVAGGFTQSRNIATVALVILVNLAFLGLTLATTQILFGPAPEASATGQAPLRRGEPSRWMVAPVVVGVLVLVVLGLAPPSDLVDLLNRGAAELGAGVR
ncbi:NADH dehydrogenase FAD-containing subunit [Mycobacterium heckeshornense]|uniref:NADH dehydrogenase n=1 Tax=Mycobacterium heckeshornense TaxID=110505 RepID=A0A2G8BA66_9MYCO|nr:proton-conducting transporter membrane subunit [Mycobacterium heckeshornense]KMV19722.1 NADH dehydrogenase [Mycobacterium heckeshornense]MCV7035737.1 NADH dehydrogenase FAD-containing subunit [Mycobacterium heckeshornense]PIJ34624.1 NADH dehydrogenase FAD-containing subunit [Mycobacterium heckeshornense]BCO36954.1 NADH dehydrogenase [Mycobacterium heckeshornense]